jgi:hypothetical protein
MEFSRALYLNLIVLVFNEIERLELIVLYLAS